MDNKLEIQLLAKNHTEKAFKSFQKRVGSLKKSVFSLNGAIVSLAGGAGIGMLANGFLQTARDFERYGVMLETITGSSEKAKKSMDWIADFTKSTPYELNQVTESFVKLEAFGLSGTRWLGTLGDTASSMGKDLNMGVEMFTDAVTGEFERLKEFGVKAKTEGDNVSFRWSENGKDMVVSAKKTQSGISGALEQIFSRFEGGMSRQARTMDGIVSNMSDQFVMVQKKFMDAGIFEEIKTQTSLIAKEFANWADQNDRLIKQNVPIYIGKTKESIKSTLKVIKDIKSLYSSVPSELTDAAGTGIIGAYLFGGQYGVLIGSVVAINQAMEKLSNSGLQSIAEKGRGVTNSILDLGKAVKDLVTGQRHWLTGDAMNLPDTRSNVEGYKQMFEYYKKMQTLKSGPSTHSNLGQLDQIIEYSSKEKESEKTKDLQAGLEERARLEKEFAEEKKKRELAFIDDYNEATLTSFQLDKLNLKKQYDFYKSHVEDKKKLDEWYSAELEKITQKNADTTKNAVKDYSDSIGTEMESVEQVTATGFQNMEDALVDYTTTGKFEYKQFASSLIAQMIRIMIQQTVMKGVTKWVGTLFSAKGNAFGSTGHLSAYAQGGAFTNKIITEPTMFAHGGGFGVMGEKGDEAVIPLTRTKSGDLGVKAVGGSSGGGAPNIQINLINNTGEDTEAKQGAVEWDGEKWVIGIILDALERNKGGFTNNFKAVMQG